MDAGVGVPAGVKCAASVSSRSNELLDQKITKPVQS